MLPTLLNDMEDSNQKQKLDKIPEYVNKEKQGKKGGEGQKGETSNKIGAL